LVTSGEFADPSVVGVSAVDHHFTRFSSATSHPEGRINLPHTVPANEEIYQQLLAIRSWN
jgi:ribosomal protein L14E/L6E/L27E